ncbi:MAG: hypothetical protein ACI4MA_08410 [Treponema sp.]
MKYSLTLREEEIKKRVAEDFFAKFETSHILGNIDFCVSVQDGLGLTTDSDIQSLLWAESKKGNKEDINESFVQLVLTIGKEKTNEKYMPPAYLGAFDAEKIAFIEYHKVLHIFSQNDFNWNVTPSNHETKEFRQLYSLCEKILDEEKTIFKFDIDEKELKEFIKNNLASGKTEKIQVTKNNFIAVFNKWCEEVMPDIQMNWEQAKKVNIFCGDFFLADLINDTSKTLYEKLDVVFSDGKYRFQREIDKLLGTEMSKTTQLKSVKKYKAFWNKYERPPKEEHWQWFIERKDLLVPQDVRERKGSFFTPKKWVELSQKYIADVLGEDWQDDYYIWDCCAGTGNLLKGLSNKRNVFASTLDKGDVGIMKELADQNVLPVFENNIFQFDFLNDDLQSEKVPEQLRKILADENERKKLVIYINPPYAEAGNKKTVNGTGQNKAHTTTENITYLKYKDKIKKAGNELFAQFFIRIYFEISNCRLAAFSTLTHLTGENGKDFRFHFSAFLNKMFIVPAYTFDNVDGEFPICFQIWDLSCKTKFDGIVTSIYDEKGDFIGKKSFCNYDSEKSIHKWIRNFKSGNNNIGYLNSGNVDFQNQSYVFIANNIPRNHHIHSYIDKNTMIPNCIFFAIRKCIPHTWINHNDQFLTPTEEWKKDMYFQSNCFVYSLFDGKNTISATHGTNHWIPFTESEVNAKQAFESTFMTDFMKGRLKKQDSGELGLAKTESTVYDGTQKIVFSEEAKQVLEAGKELYKYYYSKPHITKEANNASFYDIRASFQGTGSSGKMNPTSTDEKYNALIADLRTKQKILAKKIEPKVYEYGFLK